MRTSFERYSGVLPLLDDGYQAKCQIYEEVLKEFDVEQDDFSLRKFWSAAATRIPKLSKLALTLLAFPTNSVEC